MSNGNPYIFIFRTNIVTETHREGLRDVFERSGVLDWSVDLEDCDKVLRVVCTAGEPGDYIRELTGRGFECEELQ